MEFELSAAAKEKLAARKQRYVESLPEKREQIQALFDATQVDGAAPERQFDFHSMIHRLSGSAGLYGCQRLHQAAAALDQYMNGQSDVAIKSVEEGFAILLSTFADTIADYA